MQAVLGEPGPTFVGRMTELSDLAAEFLEMDTDSKADALATAVKLGEKLRKRGEKSKAADADRYSEIMRGFSSDAGYFETIGRQLSERLRILPSAPEEEEHRQWNAANRHLNILCDFLKDSEIDRLMQRIEHDRHGRAEL
eukprot:TRINITY_DN27106_c0_g2_i1.p1 TRINITY_DN27106_c0_g2~~TRINITY_DN27106_c0_g2_i1.p1  ORF type:complete len:140 (+),score=32.95 TRINITY_DN27106_c0_g2_i1:279-698(+)